MLDPLMLYSETNELTVPPLAFVKYKKGHRWGDLQSGERWQCRLASNPRQVGQVRLLLCTLDSHSAFSLLFIFFSA